MSARAVTLGAGAGTAALALAAGSVLLGGPDRATAGHDAPGGSAGRTATVERRSLVARETVSGSLGYGKSQATAASLSGTLTWLPAEGARIRRGEALYRVDDQPVWLFRGRIPAYRDLRYADRGADVRQLERNLRALGYDDGGDMKVDRRFDADTAAAVSDWQADRDLPQTGVMDRTRIVVLRGDRRVSRQSATVGDAARPGSPVLETTGARQVVSVDLDASKQALVRRGASVRVTLPDGREVGGRVSEIGRVAQKSGEGESASTTISVTVRLRGRAAARRYDEAPVSVAIARERRKAVLSIPVTALLAVRGGGYVVEVVEGSRVRRVPVRPGLFADGSVEVTGGELSEGQKVRVAG